jgi:hypothetical protein
MKTTEKTTAADMMSEAQHAARVGLAYKLRRKILVAKRIPTLPETGGDEELYGRAACLSWDDAQGHHERDHEARAKIDAAAMILVLDPHDETAATTALYLGIQRVFHSSAPLPACVVRSRQASKHQHRHGMQKIGGARLNSALVFLAEEAILPNQPKVRSTTQRLGRILNSFSLSVRFTI